MLEFTSLTGGLLSDSPFASLEYKWLVPGQSALAWLTLRDGTDEPAGKVLQAHLDLQDTSSQGHTAVIRVRTQSDGCSLGCRFCAASTMPTGKSLQIPHIVYQVVEMLANLVDLSAICNLVVSTKGLGEPLVVTALPEAIKRLAALLPGTKFLVSSSGHAAGKKVFEALLAMCQEGFDIDLEFSLHSLLNSWRTDNMLPANAKGRKLLWTIGQLSSLAYRWHKLTGRKVRTTFGFGPEFDTNLFDSGRYLSLFHWTAVSAQLTLEAPKDESHVWDPADYLPALVARERELRTLGYEVVRFLPAAMFQGGSCGTQTELVMLQKA